MFSKYSCERKQSEGVLPGFKIFKYRQNPPVCDINPMDWKSNEIVLERMAVNFKVGERLKYLCVTGDGLTYDLIVKIKNAYKEKINVII